MNNSFNHSMNMKKKILLWKEYFIKLGSINFLSNLTEVIEQGDLMIDRRNAFIIRYNGKRAVVKPKLFDKELKFLMTAYYEY